MCEPAFVASQNPHDAIFKRAFSSPAAVAKLVSGALPAALVKQTRWNQLRPAPNEIVGPRLQRSACDAVFLAPLRDTPGTDRLLLLLHLEHQSLSDPSMVLRTLDYGGSLLLAHHQHGDTERGLPKPPLLVPIVVAHDPRGWSAATKLDELYALNPELCAATRGFRTQHRYLLIDLSRLDNAAARARASDAFRYLVLVAMREARNKEILRQLGALKDAINAVGELPDGPDRFWMITCYICDVARNPDVTPESVTQQLASSGPAARGAAAASWERTKRGWLAEGREEGLAEGREEGLQEARSESRRAFVEILQDTLRARFGELSSDACARIEAGSAPQLRRWIKASTSSEVHSVEEILRLA